MDGDADAVVKQEPTHHEQDGVAQGETATEAAENTGGARRSTRARKQAVPFEPSTAPTRKKRGRTASQEPVDVKQEHENGDGEAGVGEGVAAPKTKRARTTTTKKVDKGKGKPKSEPKIKTEDGQDDEDDLEEPEEEEEEEEEPESESDDEAPRGGARGRGRGRGRGGAARAPRAPKPKQPWELLPVAATPGTIREDIRGGEAPAGYTTFPTGNQFMTLNCKKATLAAGQDFWEFKHWNKVGGRYVPATHAYACPTNIYQAIRAKKTFTDDKRAKNAERRDDKLMEDAEAAIDRLFPSIPATDRRAILDRAFEKGSGRIGRKAGFSIDEKVDLAARAHIRYQHTDFENVLEELKDEYRSAGERWERHELYDQAVDQVEGDVQDVVDEWRRPRQAGHGHAAVAAAALAVPAVPVPMLAVPAIPAPMVPAAGPLTIPDAPAVPVKMEPAVQDDKKPELLLKDEPKDEPMKPEIKEEPAMPKQEDAEMAV